jgi:hypothetical protein
LRIVRSQGARDEVAQHLLGHLEVRDDAVLQRLDHADLGRRAAEHRLGLVADGQDRVVILVDRDDRRLVDDDPLALHEHERVRRSQVDRDVSRESAQHGQAPLGRIRGNAALQIPPTG